LAGTEFDLHLAMRPLAFAIVIVLMAALPLRAQDVNEEPQPTLTSLPHDLLHDVKALGSTDTLIWSAIGAGATLAVYPLDDEAMVRLDRAREGTLHAVFAPGRVLGSTVVLVALSAATYGFGRATDRGRVEAIGLELIEAQLLTEGVVQALKFTVRRERPDGSDNHSMPSGHAALTFATATVLQRRFGWLPALPAYALAAYVATSRVTTDRHFLSDAVAGAFVGTITARAVTRHEGRLVHMMPVVGPGGAALMWTFAP
jgi:membrane-associated phospholipid phosphatase